MSIYFFCSLFYCYIQSKEIFVTFYIWDFLIIVTEILKVQIKTFSIGCIFFLPYKFLGIFVIIFLSESIVMTTVSILQVTLSISSYTELYFQQLNKTMQEYNLDESSLNIQQIPNMEDPQSDNQSFIFSPSLQNQCQYIINEGSTSNKPLTLNEIISRTSPKNNKHKPGSKLRRKISKSNRAKKISSYRKNICGYITKKVIRQFISGGYKQKIQEWCGTQNADYESTKNLYLSKIEGITGPSHVPSLFLSQKKEDAPLIKVFIKFFKWFLLERYVRHLFLEGKMQMKNIYIDYKNKVLLPMITNIETELTHEGQSSSTLQVPSQFDVLSIYN